MDAGTQAGRGHWLARLGPLALVTLGQLAMALHLYGPDPWAALADARPILDGRHPLHLYHAALGADTFAERMTTSCFDPQFQAGYPKTPIFDGACRPAELSLILFGRDRPERAYKLGLWLLCGLVPAACAWSAGACQRSGLLASLGGCVLWWSPPVRALLEAGHVELLGVGLAGLLFVGSLPRYSDDPGPGTWLALALAGAAGWYCQPVVWCGLAPVGLAFYTAVAPRHGPAWHLGQVAAFALGVVANLWWLVDWVRFWWLRLPSIDDVAELPSWARLVGTPWDYVDLVGVSVAGWLVVLLGLAGTLHALARGRRVFVGVVLAAALSAVLVARLGQTWPLLQPLRAAQAGTFALAVLLLPAAGLVSHWLRALPRPDVIPFALAGVPLLLALAGWQAPAPLALGFTPEQRDLMALLEQHTGPEARVLLEDPERPTPGWNWTALLPRHVPRHYLGGLDPAMGIEHGFVRLHGGRLNGRALGEWTAAERAEFVRRYNVGWVACRGAAATSWWAMEPGAREVGRTHEGGEVVLYKLERPASFVLEGAATLERLDRQKVVLTNVTPNEDNVVVLSLHHQAGMRATPSVFLVEGDKDAHDPIPFVKIQFAGPTSRVVIQWETR